MLSQIIYGSKISTRILNDLKIEVGDFKKSTGITPTLVALMVGHNPASEIYVNKKINACDNVGIMAYKIQVDQDQDQLMKAISECNNEDHIHGYILQLPLPVGWEPNQYFKMFNPLKDVDVFHPENVGLLVQGKPRFKPCTPHAIQVMLKESGIKVAGKKIVIINRSNVVGRPLSSMFIQDCDDFGNATVTVCHDKTPAPLLKSITQTADIIVVAVGKPNFLTVDMVKNGVIVIDVGINRIDNKVVGDVHPEVYPITQAYSPVPNGVGPMTIAMLLRNTLLAAKMQVYNQ